MEEHEDPRRAVTHERCTVPAGDPNGMELSLRLDPQLLVESDRLALVGEMTAALAHEILNPLSAALNLSVLLQRMAAAEELSTEQRAEMCRHLDDNVAELTRVCDMLSRVRSFCCGSGTLVELLDLSGLAEGALALASHKLKLSGVETEARLAAGLAPIRGNRMRLQQLVLDVLRFGAGAAGCREGGRVVLRTGVEANGRFVWLEVHDNGEGLPAEKLSQIFTPFATVRAVAGYAASDLAVARRLVHEVGGTIDVRSPAGGGTCVRATFPVSDSKESPRLQQA